MVCLDLFLDAHTLVPPLLHPFSCWGDSLDGHKMALSLLTLMIGSAPATKPRATKRDATDMIRSLGFGEGLNAEPQPVDSEAVKLIKRGPEYGHLTRHFLAFRMPLTRPWLLSNTADTSLCQLTTLDQM